MPNDTYQWTLFHVLIFAMILLDLGAFEKPHRAVGRREAYLWTGVWIAHGLLFGVGTYFWQGLEPAIDFLKSYGIEKLLTVGTVLCFLLIFALFPIQPSTRQRVLLGGIIGAAITRIVVGAFGVEFLIDADWLLVALGVLLVSMGIAFGLIKRLRVMIGEKEIRSVYLILILVVPVFLFATASIPAVRFLTTDWFTIYTSIIYAVLGIRVLFFAIEDMTKGTSLGHVIEPGRH